jgi:hypothetical protein
MKRTTYTLQEAMNKLGYRSANSFFQFVREYSEAFVIMKQGPGTQVHYHKATLDRFAERREHFKKEKS